MMKRLTNAVSTWIRLDLLIASLVFISLNSLNAQIVQLQNGDFEDWTSVAGPDTFHSYTTSNGFCHFLTGEASAWSVPGKVGDAIHLESHYADANLTIPGSLALGDFCNGGVNGGLHYPFSPDSLIFWTRHDVAVGDTGFIALFYRSGSSQRIALYHQFIGTKNTWTRIATPLISRPASMDTILIIAYSSDPSAGIDGSWVELDEMELKGAGPGLPNGGFETWANVGYEEPDHWGTPNTPSIWFSHVQPLTKS
ncbi:MAG: hypothetical protein AB8F95_19475, partial [Bacteroidia bacterium]